MTWLRNSLFTIATTILMLHAFVAHSHHVDKNENHHTAKEINGFIDLFEFVFHYAHADGELENYSNVETNLIAIDNEYCLISIVHFAFKQPTVNSLILTERDTFFISTQDLLEVLSRRGPPTI